MTDLFFACSWIIEIEALTTWHYVIDAARKHQVELRYWLNPHGMVSPEGYALHSYMVKTPSKEAFDQFLAAVPDQFQDWLPISAEEYERNCYLPNGMPVHTILEEQQMGLLEVRNDKWIAHQNQMLRGKLQYSVFYYGYHWPVRTWNVDKSAFWMEDLSKSSLFDFASRISRSIGIENTIGCSLRAGRLFKDNTGVNILEVFLRVFSKADFAAVITVTEIPRSAWFEIQPEQYLNGLQLWENYYYSETLHRLYLKLQTAAQENIARGL